MESIFLLQMGLSEVFSGSANFRNMIADEKISISQVEQKTFISVDERGTEAAAVTGNYILGVRIRGRYFLTNVF